MGVRRGVAGRDCGRGRNAGLRLQRGHDTRAGASFPDRVRCLSACRPLRAEGQFQPRGGRDRPFGRRARGRQLGRRDRGGPASRVRSPGHRLHRGGEDPGRDRPGGGAGGEGHQCGIGGRAGTDLVRGAATRHHRERRPPREPGHRRRQPSPHLHRSESAQVRGRDPRCAGDCLRRRPHRRASLRGAPYPRRFPDARAGAAAAGGGRRGHPGARAGGRRPDAGAPRSRRRAGHRLRRGRRRAAAGGRLRGRAHRGGAAVGVDPDRRAGARHRRPGRGPAGVLSSM